MISYIKGTIKVKEEGFVIVVTSDIGYKIFT
ncbi:Holliday junction branch migration protein RuvA, partial [Patescibacteria group bacterium]|nr:Holliday junction branch migration protein RuvA [Patescibacteria group bacterium]